MEVPKETMVSPITKFDNPSLLPIDVAPLTKKSAPLIRITNPTKNKINFNMT
jgi:hypothetical protein